MRILGINTLNHDACLTLLDGKEILFAGHAERYSGIKNDSNLNASIFADANRFGSWDKVVYYERPWKKKLRQLKAGQYSEVLSLDNLPSNYLKQFGITIDEYVDHHQSHAAASYYTSPYDESAIVCIDAIGEFNTLTIWYAWGSHFEKRYSKFIYIN